ncbi:hypothetical protein M011DRAFT_468368 [Sporormia fimetaria CBS 119925]|uniref:Cysteine dioxygenase n=1 Tax=Sporormia fimetaria CBS 119925 TaxID=1340428 RepID=A0A6A6VBN1_9PLEO|nr:hypothetical protein M011DRAFT_468368 [Sporormia fimetaria CBS 119925]
MAPLFTTSDSYGAAESNFDCHGVSKSFTFDALVDALMERLGPASGISDLDVDPKELQALMWKYFSTEAEWQQYFFKVPLKPYTRNLVHKGNGKCNLLILVWSPGKCSPVHDHANAHCIMKVLKGRLKETRYRWPTVELNKGEKCPLEVERETVYNQNEVTYMSDELGLHKISNLSPDEYAVSLHLYTPPNAAVYGCHTFNELTGQPSHQKTCPVYSEYGRKIVVNGT